MKGGGMHSRNGRTGGGERRESSFREVEREVARWVGAKGAERGRGDARDNGDDGGKGRRRT